LGIYSIGFFTAYFRIDFHKYSANINVNNHISVSGKKVFNNKRSYLKRVEQFELFLSVYFYVMLIFAMFLCLIEVCIILAGFEFISLPVLTHCRWSLQQGPGETWGFSLW
jgi:hypothetical protein